MDWSKKQVKAHPIVSVVVVIWIIGAIGMALDDEDKSKNNNAQTEYDIKKAEKKALEGNIDNYRSADVKYVEMYGDEFGLRETKDKLYKIPMRIIGRDEGGYQVRYGNSGIIYLYPSTDFDPDMKNKLKALAHSGQPFYAYCLCSSNKRVYANFVEY